MEPQEELFDIQFDPYEMRNLLQQPSEHPGLAIMRHHYDIELQKWRDKAVPFNNYQPFGTVFDRSVSWEKKKELLSRKK